MSFTDLIEVKKISKIYIRTSSGVDITHENVLVDVQPTYVQVFAPASGPLGVGPSIGCVYGTLIAAYYNPKAVHAHNNEEDKDD